MAGGDPWITVLDPHRQPVGQWDAQKLTEDFNILLERVEKAEATVESYRRQANSTSQARSAGGRGYGNQGRGRGSGGQGGRRGGDRGGYNNYRNMRGGEGNDEDDMRTMTNAKN
ncbi:hypothetical protein STCU_12369 [Strigomonas culicis]|uniref:Uncharacterized protein n=1 Tax=Strigomonas culicis TaxID=28005 RepID=S9UK59_9TRYP|nr:hypothetical protein STCU_12369 [Strigomonas culicis]|eukprot:EPY15056.1 hypothetical protein STCU_12369 [Strigomonas culicis]